MPALQKRFRVKVGMLVRMNRLLAGTDRTGQTLSNDRFRLLELLLAPAKPEGRPREADTQRLPDTPFYVKQALGRCFCPTVKAQPSKAGAPEGEQPSEASAKQSEASRCGNNCRRRQVGDDN